VQACTAFYANPAHEAMLEKIVTDHSCHRQKWTYRN